MICQRENSFYIDTVRAFRDRRYEYKGLLKVRNLFHLLSNQHITLFILFVGISINPNAKFFSACTW